MNIIRKISVVITALLLMTGCEQIDDNTHKIGEQGERLDKLDKDQAKDREDIDQNRREIESLKDRENAGGSKKAEREEQLAIARRNLKSIADGAVSYYMAEHYDRTGMPLPQVLPPEARWTPEVPCCKTSRDGFCDTKQGNWGAEGWKKVKFRPVEQDSFQYRTILKDEKTLEVQALGNPGCKGKLTTLSLTVSVNDQREVSITKVTTTEGTSPSP